MPISSDPPDTEPGERPAVATACGKLILVGEHSVVYGEPALAVPLSPLRLSVVLSDPRSDGWRAVADASSVPVDLGADTDGVATQTMAAVGSTTLDREQARPLTIDLDDDAPDGAHAAVSRALGAAARALDLPVPLPLRIAVRPGGLTSGMGTSAALGVAIARALLAWHGVPTESARVLAAAEAVERLFHGTPSGIDHTVSALEQPLWFIKGQEPLPLLDLAPLLLVLRPRQSASPTSEVVRGVRGRLAETPALVRTVAAMGRTARLARAAWEAGDLRELAHAMTTQQEALDRLGVVDDEDRLGIAAGLAAGALVAKITGAGRGGTLLALVADDASAAAVLEVWGPGALVVRAGG